MDKLITANQIFELLGENKLGRITRDQLQAFLMYPLGWRNTGEIIEYDLKLGRDAISAHVAEGNYEHFVSPNISTLVHHLAGRGFRTVRFKLVPGKLFQKPEPHFHYCEREDFQLYCQDHQLREPNAAEATLYPAMDRQVGIKSGPLYAFIHEEDAMFSVSSEDGKRQLLWQKASCTRGYSSDRLFLAVCV